MIFAGNQPYFLPYIGYWQLINAVDVFEIMDDYHYINRGWINRNRILINGKPSYYHIEIQKASQNKKINELSMVDYSIDKKMNQLKVVYGKAPFYKEGETLMEQIYSCSDRNVAGFLAESIQSVCNYLGIDTKLVKSSDFAGNDQYKCEYRIYDICQRIGADTYINAIGGQELYSYEEFRKRGLQLGFLKSGDIRYEQFGQEFVPNLSILDVIMFNDRETIQNMLQNYSIITEKDEKEGRGGE